MVPRIFVVQFVDVSEFVRTWRRVIPIHEVGMAGCSLPDVDFSGLYLAHAKFKNVDLRGADFSDAYLGGADFR